MDKLSSKGDEQRPRPDDFDLYLPWACKQLEVDAAVSVNKVVQHEYVSAAVTDRSKSKGKSKCKLTSSRAEFSDQNKEDKSFSALQTWPTMDRIVKIHTIYDHCDNLVHIKLDNNREIPQIIMKIIGMVVKFQIYLTGITINRGLDVLVLHEVCKLLPFSHITDICLDNTFLPEGNYHILLEKPSLLRQLSLAGCRIDDAVVENIAILLSNSSPASNTIVTLNLSSNRITDAGAKCFGEALRTNRKLCYLNLASNAITDNGADYILSSLMEFPMTYDEIITARSRHMAYLRQKKELISHIIKDLKAGAFDKQALKRKSIRPSTVQTRKSRVDKEPSIKAIMDPNPKSLGNLDAIWYDKAATMAENILGFFNDPFNSYNTYSKDGIVYCYGNNSLCYLNMAYNNLSYFSVRKLLNVMTQQRCLDRKPRGLINVFIEGNCIPNSCKELTKLDEILEMGLLAHRRSLSALKKKPTPRSGK